MSVKESTEKEEVSEEFEEEIAPEEKNITISVQPSSEGSTEELLTTEATIGEICKDFIGGAIRVCAKVNTSTRRVQVKAYLAGQRIGAIELSPSSLSREWSANLGVVRGKAKVTVDWNARNVKAEVQRCKREFRFPSWRWVCQNSNNVIVRW
jgi:hypothetical protein